MPPAGKRLLLLYTDKYYLIRQVYPFGLDVLANHLRAHGHEAVIDYPFLPGEDMEANVARSLERHAPDVVGLGIRNLDTCMSCEKFGDFEGEHFRAFNFPPLIRRIVHAVRTAKPDLPIILGGGGFTIAPAELLAYLDVEYGVAGEGEEPLLRFVETLPDREAVSRIPGLAVNRNGSVRVNPRQDYAFTTGPEGLTRDPGFAHSHETMGLPVQVKRGCNRKCSYCVEPLIEGSHILYRDPFDVIQELQTVDERYPAIQKIFFVDTEFNVPDLKHCSELVTLLLHAGLEKRFRFASQFLPRPFDDDFAALLARAGFSVVLTCDSLSDTVLRANHVAHSAKDILHSIELCERHGLDLTVNLIFGLPGETFETLDQTMEALLRHPPAPGRRYEYTLGGRVYPGTRLHSLALEEAGSPHLYGAPTPGLLEPYFYCAPLPPLELKEYVESRLSFSIEFNNRFTPEKHKSLAIRYLVDRADWDKAAALFAQSTAATQADLFDYFFRKATAVRAVDTARTVLDCVRQSAPPGGELSAMADFYASLLP